MKCNDKYCDDPNNIPADEMIGKYCVTCHEARMDNDEANRQNEPDLN